ncbi:MAG: Na+/H+ antiporter subunit A, partial [Thermoprotei archaeon]
MSLSVPLILQPLIILFLGAVLVPLVDVVGKRVNAEKLKDFFAVAIFALALYKLYTLYLEVAAEGYVEFTIPGFGPPFGSALRVDALSSFMSMLFCGVGLLVAIYSIRYMEEDTGLDKYYALLLAMVAGMVGVAFAWDFLTLFVFWET